MKVILLNGNTEESVKKRIQIVASAGNLSRSSGTVTEVYERHTDYESNLRLASAIVGYGHKSIAEHDYLVFALEDVTPIVEQTLIGYRLTSFTIKSRRNVDFRSVGFYVPDFKDNEGNILKNNEDLKIRYTNYMQSLFNKYGELVDEELPIEDCRYILPYSYFSNIIMGCDAHELVRITSDLLYGKLSKIDELKEVGTRFYNIIKEYVPYLVKYLEKEKNKSYYEDAFTYLDELVNKDNCTLLNKVNLTNYDKDSENVILRNIIMSRYQMTSKESNKILEELSKKDSKFKEKLMNSLISSKFQREMEQVSFSFEMPISLASLTHITRHRTHSLITPDFVPIWNLDNKITPESIKNTHLEEYNNIFKLNKEEFLYFKNEGVRDEDLVYFYLSGSACNIYTTMNGRTLEWISRMRCCTKAQWEIRGLMNECVELVKKVFPLYSKCLGPTCEVEGYCPEGKDSCKLRGVVIKRKEDKK